MISLDHLRAQRAFRHATDAASQNFRKDFLSLTRGLPAMLQNNGLLATWAFLLSKNNPHDCALLNAILEHFRDENFELGVHSTDIVDVFITDWTGDQNRLSMSKLMLLTAEAICFSGWLKRAAETLCDQG